MALQFSIDRGSTAVYLERFETRWKAAQCALAEAEQLRAIRNETSDRLMAKIILQMKTRAAVRVAAAIKRRARQFMQRPTELNGLASGLSNALPQKMIAMGQQILRREMTEPRRFMGFGGEIPALNAKALILTGRYQCYQRYLGTRRWPPPLITAAE